MDITRLIARLAGSALAVASVGIAWQWPPDAGLAAEPVVTVVGADAEQRARLAHALARFEAAGLRLADFEIVFSDDASVCAGHLGGFRRRGDAAQVSVCNDLEFIVVHELAHVWLDANVDEDERRRVRASSWAGHLV